MLSACFLLLPFSIASQSACDQSSGNILRETYSSRIIGQQMYFSVYLPPCYEQVSELYPTVYLMHGSNEDDGHWQRLGIAEVLDAGIQAGTLPAMIVVLPFGNWIANENQFDVQSWGNIFLSELMPEIEGNYRVDARRERQAIGGISRGGFWAYQIGLRHPELFHAIGGHSAFFDPFHAPPESNPLDLAAEAPDIESMRFWLDRGAFDFAADGLDRMAVRLLERGLDYIYEVYPQGEHNNIYWSQHIAEYLQFYAADWLDNADDEPSVSAEEPEDAILLFVPVVRFPSLQTSISHERLASIVGGGYDDKLILDEETLNQLTQQGVKIHPDTRIVEGEALFTHLWLDGTRFAIVPFDQLPQRSRMLWVDDVPIVDRLDVYPLAFDSDNPNFYPDRLTRFTFSGVTALARNTRIALDENGIEWAGEAILPYVTRADYFHTSVETSIYPTCPQTTGDLLGGSSSFCMKPEHFELLPFLDVDVVELTGNHNNDYGYEAYTDTLAAYAQAEIATVGGGATLTDARTPYIAEHNGNSIALLSCNFPGPYYALVNEEPELLGGVRPGAAACDWAWLEATIPVLAAQVDILVVTVQYQEYEDYLPTDQQRFDYRRLAELGADVVMGTAEHKPQIFEFYGTRRGTETLLHYGMGNLFFDQPFWGNMRFFMDTLYIYQGQLHSVELFPGIIEDFGRPRLMTPEEHEAFLHFMFVQQNGF